MSARVAFLQELCQIHSHTLVLTCCAVSLSCWGSGQAWFQLVLGRSTYLCPCAPVMDVASCTPAQLAQVASLNAQDRQDILTAILAFEAAERGVGVAWDPPQCHSCRTCASSTPGIATSCVLIMVRVFLSIEGENRKIKPHRRRPHRRHFCRPCLGAGFGADSESD